MLHDASREWRQQVRCVDVGISRTQIPYLLRCAEMASRIELLASTIAELAKEAEMVVAESEQRSLAR